MKLALVLTVWSLLVVGLRYLHGLPVRSLWRLPICLLCAVSDFVVGVFNGWCLLLGREIDPSDSIPEFIGMEIGVGTGIIALLAAFCYSVSWALS